MDIKVTTEGFNGTTVTFTAVNETGEKALQKMGGGFACIGMTVRKSIAGDFQMDLEHAHNCKVVFVGG